MKKYIFLLLVFRLRLIINHALGVSVFFIFSLVQAWYPQNINPDKMFMGYFVKFAHP